ncbi:MAG: M20/M25/M40 family metallo-hydrolase [Bacteroidales bacterium]|nr:M20/M25/M40 family metallo-hydrolase [Bacteroidales bacterium]
MDYRFFKEILCIDSTSGKERELSDLLAQRLPVLFPDAQLKLSDVGDGTQNLLLSKGDPRMVFCTHLDTVPPYLPPVFVDASGSECAPSGAVSEVRGRGACDAKGQLFAMVEACRRLYAEGVDGWGLLLLSGEETGSWGAKAFSKTGFQAPWLIIGEPTDGKMVSASKGTLSYDLLFTGAAFHSGYPLYGRSAVELFTDFMVALEYADFPKDKLLGNTTWNVGLLRSDNPQNILSPSLRCRLYFRTTFASHEAVRKYMESNLHRPLAGPEKGSGACRLDVTPRGGDVPAQYEVLPDFPSCVAAFGSDAPHLTGFAHKIICGPGSILVAHRDDECVSAAGLEHAAEQYVEMYQAIVR